MTPVSVSDLDTFDNLTAPPTNLAYDIMPFVSVLDVPSDLGSVLTCVTLSGVI